MTSAASSEPESDVRYVIWPGRIGCLLARPVAFPRADPAGLRGHALREPPPDSGAARRATASDSCQSVPFDRSRHSPPGRRPFHVATTMRRVFIAASSRPSSKRARKEQCAREHTSRPSVSFRAPCRITRQIIICIHCYLYRPTVQRAIETFSRAAVSPHPRNRISFS